MTEQQPALTSNQRFAAVALIWHGKFSQHLPSMVENATVDMPLLSDVDKERLTFSLWCQFSRITADELLEQLGSASPTLAVPPQIMGIAIEHGLVLPDSNGF